MILHSETFPCSTPGCTGNGRDASWRGGHTAECASAIEGDERVFFADTGCVCCVCDQWIPRGCKVRKLDGMRRHDECPDVVQIPKAPNGVCPRCWLARAVNGTCGCE